MSTAWKSRTPIFSFKAKNGISRIDTTIICKGILKISQVIEGCNSVKNQTCSGLVFPRTAPKVMSTAAALKSACTQNYCNVRTGIVLLQFCDFLNMKGKGPNAKRQIENWVACAHHTRDCVFAYRDERLHAYFDAKPSGIYCLAGISNERLAIGLEIIPSTVHETVD